MAENATKKRKAKPAGTGARTRGHRLRAYGRFAVAVLAAIVLLNAVGFSRAFCDWYVSCAYPVLTEPFSRVFALVPFAVGEVVMLVGIAALVVGIVLAVLLVFLRKRAGYRRFVRGYWKTVAACVLVVGLLFTLNWAIPFRATPLADILKSGAANAEYTIDQLEELRNGIVVNLNKTAEQAPRDGDGALEYAGTDEENAQIAQALQGLSGEFPQLDGFYPAPKVALISDVLEWMDIGGYTYPYTEEITYNSHVSKLYYPLLAAHESVHHKGWFMESDAEFLSFLALSRSDDAILRYSAYESMYSFANSAYKRALTSGYGEEKGLARYNEQVQLSEQVVADIKRDQEQRDAAYSKSVNKGAEQAFSGAAKDASEYGWSAQSQVLQGNTYSGVVGLLLGYFYG